MLGFKIAFRNLFLHKVKTGVIGFIIVFGTTLAIVGNAFVDAISSGMQRSLTESVTGEIQVYSADSKDKLSIFGGMDGGMPDISHVADFSKVRDVLLEKVPNIKSVIPMGTNNAMWNPGNILDVKLEDLRALYGVPAIERDRAKIAALKAHIHSIITDVKSRITETSATISTVLAKDEVFAKAPGNLEKALAPTFWSTFDSGPQERIEFLGNNISPLIFDDGFVWLNYLGTVPGTFRNAFSQFEIVKGQEIPDGKRGFLFSDYVYETFIKNRVARKLDQVKKRLDHGDGAIEKNQVQRDAIAACVSQAAEVYSQVSPEGAKLLLPKLQAFLKSKSTELSDLVREFLNMNDSNFYDRYKFFYAEIAPQIVLYRVRVGDVFPVTAFSKSGYATSVNMKVYGTYRFKSFENSPIAGNFNIMDMMSFRELYGFMTAEKRNETLALDSEMGIKDIGRDNIEEMFAAPSEVKTVGQSGAIGKAMPKSFNKFEARKRVFELTYTEEEMNRGVFLNAAIKLKDTSQLSQTLKEIEAVSASEKLGLKAIDWRESAGMMGQLTVMVRAVLYLLMAVTFGIATFIIMNSMLMATMERTREIGTMRAIGAQRGFLMSLFLQETALLSFIFGLLGTFIGVLIIATIGAKGIPAMGDPAQGDVSTFFFSGDRLFLTVNPLHILVVFVCMTLVAIISTQYPAWRAMRISPLEAIQSKE